MVMTRCIAAYYSYHIQHIFLYCEKLGALVILSKNLIVLSPALKGPCFPGKVPDGRYRCRNRTLMRYGKIESTTTTLAILSS